ncbi:acetyltransferase [Gallaecimonas xiamenensis]|uniref:Carbonic anhydrase/acetyltransferase isoleucine patch superfamily-like protein n=1 Tax=Gallaecimonas xiamenensis 3-C-1 TaxID=745411 RepID=K2IY73_9GAMM|nr:acetyltransferase [Gallaecimonas xiamenensis]EKE75431.1 carbonic anhydrase/acetyltransferase isoleucine patch superfamily-like protein [Gallaecimonas xiamenensis 3-C-1]
MAKPLVMLGAGGHAAVLAEMLGALGLSIEALVTPDPVAPRRPLAGIPVLASDEALLARYRPDEVELVNGIGALPGRLLRQASFERFSAQGYRFAQVISPQALVSPSAELAEGVQVMPGAIIQSCARIAANTIINSGAIVEHDCQLGPHNHVAPGATLSGAVCTGIGVHIGTGANVIQSVNLGQGAVVGAGATAVRDLAPGHTLLPASQRLRG